MSDDTCLYAIWHILIKRPEFLPLLTDKTEFIFTSEDKTRFERHYYTNLINHFFIFVFEESFQGQGNPVIKAISRNI